MKKLLTAFSFFIFHFSFFTLYSQNIGINTTGSKPDSSAVLDLNSPNKGFLMPRVALKSLTDVTTIPNPAQYLMVFNTTTQCMVYFTGAVWQNIVCPCTGAPSTPGVISGYATPCTSSAGNVYIIAAVSGANSYTWLVPTGATITSGAGTTSITVTFGTTSGNINVTAVNSCGTSGASVLAVTLSSVPSAPVVPSGSASVSVSTSSTYTIAPVSGATSYTWSVSNTNNSVSAGQGTTSAVISFGSTPATMNICVTADDTCGSSAPSCLSVTTSTCVVTHNIITFNYTGAQQTWVVPACITSVTLTATGAQGVTVQSSSGGLGGSASGALAVTGGQTLYIYVGGQSLWNGGGAAGTGSSNSGYNGGNGGDASDIRIGGTALSNRIIVGGGGGGAGRGNGCSSQTGGNGGGPGGDGGLGGNYSTQNGQNGGTDGGNGGVGGGANSCTSSGGGGGGGGQNGGGAGGGYTTVATGGVGGCGQNGTDGGGGTGSAGAGGCFGQGGAGGNFSNGGGGGGGGGWWGGGAGGGNWAAGGGGGSSYIGGVTGGSYSNGVQSGNGQVLIQY